MQIDDGLQVNGRLVRSRQEGFDRGMPRGDLGFIAMAQFGNRIGWHTPYIGRAIAADQR